MDQDQEEIISSYAFIVMINENFGLTPKEILDSSIVLLFSMIREKNYMENKKDRIQRGLKRGEQIIEVIDFKTGEPKLVKKAIPIFK